MKNDIQILNEVNLSKLDQFEYMLYCNFIEKSNMNKAEALTTIINNYIDDIYQLSPVLRRIAKKFLTTKI